MSDLEKKLGLSALPMNSAEREVFRQLFFHGPTWDGDLVSKSGRDDLVSRGLAKRHDGWQTLTEAGFIDAVEAGYGDQKEVWDNLRRRRS